MTEPTTNATPPRRRWWLWIATAAALVVFLSALAIGLHVRRFHLLRTHIEHLGGELLVDTRDVREYAPRASERLLGPFGIVRGVAFYRTGKTRARLPLADEHLAGLVDELERFSTLEGFAIVACPRGVGCAGVTDAGVAEIRRLRQLRSLSLEGTSVTDAGLKNLADDLPHLRHLGLSRTAVTDEAMEDVARLPDLEILRLDETTVGDEGLRALARLPRLRELSLTQTWTTDSGIQTYLGHLPDLSVTDD